MAYLPDAFIDPLRVGAKQRTVEVLFSEPLLFAAHYATIADVVIWPKDIETVLAGVRSRYGAHDAVLGLIDTLRGQVPMALSADLARRMAEGLELHTVLDKRCETYTQLCTDTLQRILRHHEGFAIADDTSPGSRMALLAQLLEFSPAQTKVLAYALVYTVAPALQLFTRMFSDQRWSRPLFWQTLLDLEADALANALSAKGRLAGSGLLKAAEGIPKMSEFWVELLVKTDSCFETNLLQSLSLKDSPGGAARLPAEDREILLTLLACREAGINVLVHGKPSVDKQRLAYGLIQEAGGTAHTMAADIPERDQPAAVMVAQRLLARSPGRPILVIQKTQKVLTRVLPEAFAFLGLGDEDEEVRPLDERLA